MVAVFITIFITALRDETEYGELLLLHINRWYDTDYRDSLLNLLILRVIMAFRYQPGCASVSWKLLHCVIEIVFDSHAAAIILYLLYIVIYCPALYTSWYRLVDHNYHRIRASNVAGLISMLIFVHSRGCAIFCSHILFCSNICRIRILIFMPDFDDNW